MERSRIQSSMMSRVFLGILFIVLERAFEMVGEVKRETWRKEQEDGQANQPGHHR
jgi:hypothetical protein